MTTLRLGLAGLGHGDTLLQANNPEHELPIRVTALCDVNESRLDAAARKHGIGAVTTDFDELAARDDIDIIGIYNARAAPRQADPDGVGEWQARDGNQGHGLHHGRG